jgi:hypothetical protein
MRLTGVLKHGNPALCGDSQDSVHVGGGSPKVHRKDRARIGRDGRLNLIRVDLESLYVRIHEDRKRMLQQNWINTSDKRIRRDNHFVARSAFSH